MFSTLANKLADWGWSALKDRRRLRLTVHVAAFDGAEARCFFVNATNLSRNRELEITHVWFDCQPPVAILQPKRPLPKRLGPDETWETWVEVGEVPSAAWDDVFELARARLSTGAVIKSKKNRTVPIQGNVPG